MKIWKKVSIYYILERKHENKLKERKLRRSSIKSSDMDWFPLTDLNIVQNVGYTLFMDIPMDVRV